MKLISDHHLHGETICRIDFPEEHASLTAILEGLAPTLYPADDFTPHGRPPRPKRHMREIAGLMRPVLLPVNQAGMNAALRSAFEADGWSKEPVAAGPMAGPDAPLSLRGDFVRGKVFVEVEFGNVASMHRDFFKFQIANRSGAGDVGVLVVATKRLAYFFDTNVATFETAVRNKPYLAIGVQMPIWILGIEPDDFDAAFRARYGEMLELCEANGVECHPFDAAMHAAGSAPDSADDLDSDD
jgi:hypothetical protein